MSRAAVVILAVSLAASVAACFLPRGQPCCTANADCADGAQCFEGRCAVVCNDASECNEGEVCDATARVCTFADPNDAVLKRCTTP